MLISHEGPSILSRDDLRAIAYVYAVAAKNSTSKLSGWPLTACVYDYVGPIMPNTTVTISMLHCVVVVNTVVTVCLPCFGLSLDCGQMLSATGGLCPRRPDLSGFVLSIFYLLCKLH